MNRKITKSHIDKIKHALGLDYKDIPEYDVMFTSVFTYPDSRLKEIASEGFNKL